MSGCIRTAPKAIQPHIGIFGRRNAGKSSLLNYILGYEHALVSPVPGTTTDTVEKSIELPLIGPVTLIDTPGLDDAGELGEKRVQKSLDSLNSVHLALLVTDGLWGKYEREFSALLRLRKIPFIVVWSKHDSAAPEPASLAALSGAGVEAVAVSAAGGYGRDELNAAIMRALPDEAMAPPLMLGDLLRPGAVCLFVAPIDASAPKARLIAPQAQALRDALDAHAVSLLIQPEELGGALAALSAPPALAVCDSQAVSLCAAKLPQNVPLTTFSILMARLKGDLATLAAGAAAVHTLKDGDLVCISEACAHHAQDDDIGRVKIPALLRKHTGKELDIRFASGRDYPADLADYKLIIHCGGCMIGRPLMLARLEAARRAGVPITNYGVCISLMQGVLERALQIFPDALAAFRANTQRSSHNATTD